MTNKGWRWQVSGLTSISFCKQYELSTLSCYKLAFWVKFVCKETMQALLPCFAPCVTLSKMSKELADHQEDGNIL